MAYRVLVLAGPADLDEALGSTCDAIVIDLADERIDDIGRRSWTRDACEKAHESEKRAVVRINHPKSPHARRDLNGVATEHLDAVILPHATEPQDVRDLGVLLREFEHTRDIEPGRVAVFPTIDTARGLLRAHDIATAVPRVEGLVFDGARYARDVGARSEEVGHRLSYARGALVAAARAAGGLPLVASEGTEFRQLSHYGFAGVLLSSAKAAVTAAAAFAPSAGDLKHAEGTVAAFDAARADGDQIGRASCRERV